MLAVRTVQGRAYGAAQQKPEPKKLVALRLPADLHDRIVRKMRSCAMTKTDVMVRALEDVIP